MTSRNIGFYGKGRDKFPGGLPYEKALGRVLGKKYELDIIFVQKGKMKSLNKLKLCLTLI